MSMFDSEAERLGRIRWWDEDEGTVGEALVQTVDRLRGNDDDRIFRDRVHDDIYTGRAAQEAGWSNYLLVDETGIRDGVNFTASAIDTLHARVCTQRPGVRVSGQGADYRHILRARYLSRYLEAQQDELRVDEQSARAAMQAMRLGTGVVGTSIEGGRVSIEVVPLEELYVDPADAMRGRPRRMHRLRAMDRDRLIELYPDHDREIEEAPPTQDDWSMDRRIPQDADLVDVYEGWYLPDHDGEGGRHVVCLRDGTVLADDPWRHARHPFAWMYAVPPDPGSGFWGMGLVERVADLQYQIDELVTQINEQIAVGSRLKIFVDRGGAIDIDQLVSSKIGAIVEIDQGGRPPTFASPDPVSMEAIQHLQWLIQQLYTVIGVNQQDASSQKQAGINSGRAILYHDDIKTQRHAVIAKAYRQLVLDICDLLIDRAKDLDEAGVDWPASLGVGSRTFRRVSWKDVDMDRDMFVLRLQPVSPVAETFAGHLQMVEQYAAEGRLPEQFAASLIEDPDMGRMYRQLRADNDLAEFVIERLLDPDAEMPGVYDDQNLELSAQLVRAALQEVRCQEVEGDQDFEAVVARFERYLGELFDRSQPPPPPPGPPGPAAGAMDPAMGTMGATGMGDATGTGGPPAGGLPPMPGM